MGRWSQYRRRGRGVPVVSSAWPGLEWTAGNDLVDHVTAMLADPGSAPFPSWQMAWSDNEGASWNEGDPDLVEFTLSMATPGSGTYWVRVRGIDELAQPATDWSDHQETVIP